MVGKTEFKIGGWLAPENTVEAYELAKECGVNSMYLLGEYCGTAVDKKQIEAIEVCKKCGMLAIPTVDRTMDGLTKTEFLQYDHIPSFLMYDEPSLNTFSTLVEKIKQFNACYQGKIECEINLNPSYMSAHILGTENYEEYVARFSKEVYPYLIGNKHFSLDYYPMYAPNGGYNLDPAWLRCLNIFSFYAQENGAPMHCFIQTMPFGANDIKQDFASLRFQFMTYLAMGFTAFSHFCYASPGFSNEFKEHQEAIIGRDLKPTRLYEEVKKANAHVQTFAESVLAYTYQGTCPVAAEENYEHFEGWKWQKKLSQLCLKEVKTDKHLLLGLYENDNKKKALFVTNYTSMSSGAGDIILRFDKEYDFVLQKDGVRTRSKGTELKIALEDGNGVWIEIGEIEK